ncbi:MAG: hypothetical protein MJZ20_03720 [Bacteroidaceae bacterium]|nr:hypothetical protein [Bacteroidaceae bacterium]
MAKYNGLIIPRSYNDYFSRSDPQAIKKIIAMSADAALNISSTNPIQNKVIAQLIPAGVSSDNQLAAAADIDAINELIPNTASADNQLADKNFVNSTVGTNTAIFRGTFNSLEELEAYAGEKTNNDYAFVITTDSAGNAAYNRYKYDGEAWEFEYTLNNSSFTAEQWAAIQSGITAELVEKIGEDTGSWEGTHAEYEALEEPLPAGTKLFFTDDYDSEIGNPNYSTEETYTGAKWIDGKKIYRKVVEASTFTTSNPLNVNISNINKVIDIRQMRRYDNRENLWTCGDGQNTENSLYFSYESFGISIHPVASSTTIYSFTAIIDYTKTTD